MSSFCIAKATHIFSAKNFSIFAYHLINFNESLANDIVSFEQLGPGELKLPQEMVSHLPKILWKMVSHLPKILWKMVSHLPKILWKMVSHLSVSKMS